MPTETQREQLDFIRKEIDRLELAKKEGREVPPGALHMLRMRLEHIERSLTKKAGN